MGLKMCKCEDHLGNLGNFEELLCLISLYIYVTDRFTFLNDLQTVSNKQCTVGYYREHYQSSFVSHSSIQHNVRVSVMCSTHTHPHSCGATHLPKEMSGVVNFTTHSNVQSHSPRAARHCSADQKRHSVSSRLYWSSQYVTQNLNQEKEKQGIH